MTEIEAVIVEDEPRAAAVPAGSLHAGHLGALIEVRDGHGAVAGRLKAVEHDRTMMHREPRTKLNVDLEGGGVAWLYVEPSRPVLIIKWKGADRG